MEDETTVNHLARLCNSKTSRIVPGYTLYIVYFKTSRLLRTGTCYIKYMYYAWRSRYEEPKSSKSSRISTDDFFEIIESLQRT